MKSRELVDDEELIVYNILILTEEQFTKGTLSSDCLTIDSYDFNEAKGIAKGALKANDKYTYALILEVSYIHEMDGTLIFNSSQLVYSIWAKDNKFKQMNSQNKTYS